MIDDYFCLKFLEKCLGKCLVLRNSVVAFLFEMYAVDLEKNLSSQSETEHLRHTLGSLFQACLSDTCAETAGNPNT